MSNTKHVILLTAGDPASISTEITIKAIESQRINKNINLVVITDPTVVHEYKKLIKSDIKINEIKDKIEFSDYKNNRPIRMGFRQYQSLDKFLSSPDQIVNTPKFGNYVDTFKYRVFFTYIPHIYIYIYTQLCITINTHIFT